MKNAIKFRSLVFSTGLMLVMFFFTSCIKEGPEGPQGPQGAAGNANVHTYTFTTDLALFEQVASSGEYYTTINLTNVNVGYNDAVLVYYNRETIGSVDYWAQLPFDDWYSSSMYNHFSFEIGENSKMYINIRNSTGIAPYNPMTGDLFFKVVVIRGYAGKKAVVPASVNTANYTEVEHYYKLSD